MGEVGAHGRLWRALRAIALDASLLRRRREFRLLTLGQFVSVAGAQMTFVALPVQCYSLTHSTLAVGLLGAAEFVPILLLALVGGALADAFDRRRLIALAEIGALAVAVVLVVNALLDDPAVWLLFLAAALFAACDALRRPPLDALEPRLVEREEFKAAFAVKSALWNVGALGGPALAGVLIASVGYAATYAVDAASFVVALATLAMIRTPPPPPDAAAPSLRSVVDGLRYAASRQELIGTYVVDINAMFFGMPLAVFPALATRLGDPAVVGLLYAAPAAGGLIASLTSGWTAHVHRHGRAVVLAAVGWGVAIACFGLTSTLWLALAFLAVAGAGDEISGIFRGVIWNSTIPDELRGRLAGVEMLSWASGPTLGTAEAGAAASLVGLRASVVAGGVLCVAGSGAIAAALPAFWRYDARTFTAPPPSPVRTTPAPL
jgi:MFS family permease